MEKKPLLGTLGAIQVEIPAKTLFQLAATFIIIGLVLILSFNIIKKL
ncbi:MAG: hypothetical protein NTW16_00760 [Bacteroidetes bacterium]|nr:hypothetical protein [Bacteroidota bacterium]